MKTQGYIHLYTGNGKGKTTAAFGQALRAAGDGKKVFIAQFVKGMKYSEIDAVEKFLPHHITTRQYGLECFINREPSQADIDAARKGIDEVKTIIAGNEFDMIILDEICIALYYKLLETSEVIGILKQKHIPTEIVLTGRYAPEELINFADLVTEMREVKHYYTSGVMARKGIEF